MFDEIRREGILSAAAAKRILRPELAGAHVQYEPHPVLNSTRGVYYGSERICGCVGIGPDGIQPVEQQTNKAAGEGG